MAKFMGPRFKLCRRLGLNVIGHPKAMDRAVKGTSRADKKLSDYGVQLLEKQRLRAYYGVLEKQFERYVVQANKNKGLPGENLLILLESRLDNLVYRAGFANSIRQARQMVNHGHIEVNGFKVDIPSYKVNPGDFISLRESSRNNIMFKENFNNSMITVPYLEKNLEEFKVRMVRKPERMELPIQINEQLIIEYYSK